jgi:isopenicillin N synthase-like dioxygenase
VAQIDAVTASSNSFVPVIDIAPYLAGTPEGKRRVAAELDRACREVGFYIIVGHGVEPRLIEQVETVSREFFDLPLDVHRVLSPSELRCDRVLSADLRRPWSRTRV